MTWAKRDPEGQRLTLNNHWTACATLFQSSASSNSLPAKSPVLCWVLPTGPVAQGLTQPWIVPSDADMKNMVIPFGMISPPIFSGNNSELSKNCLPCQKTSISQKLLLGRSRLTGIIILQQITPKTTRLEETERICDSPVGPHQGTQTTCILSCARSLLPARDLQHSHH